MNFIPWRRYEGNPTATSSLQQSTIDKMSIKELSVGTLNAVMKLGATGSIQSALSGTRIQITADEIAGYNGTTKQFYISSVDGKAYCGAGAVVLDTSGITIAGNAGSNWLTLTGTSGTGFIAFTDSLATKTATINLNPYGDILVHAELGSCINLSTDDADPASALAYCIRLGGRYMKLPQHTADAPNSEGNCYYDSTNHLLKYYNGTAWKTVATV